ncbi:MAG TPA: M48 family metalloprotease [Chitinophagaceae bacterium]
MSTNNKYLFFCFISFVYCYCLAAQKSQLYTYQDLSNFSYKNEKDSIKKKWVCPELFKVKETQNKFKEIWASRTEFFINSIESNNFIKDDDVYDYINHIIFDIVKDNPLYIKQMPLLVIDRSGVVNAYSIGNNTIIVNAGLITFSQSREEIALALAHELAHDILNHTENAMKERALLLTSEEYKKSLNTILETKYERLSRLKKVIEGYSFNRNRHNRYHEGEADSMAIVLLKNSNIPFNPAFFLRLDSTDYQYKKELSNPVKNYFKPYDIIMEDQWFEKRSKGLSSKNYNFKDTTTNNDSLKTHPDCLERYNNTKSYQTTNAQLTPIPEYISEKMNKVLIWNLFNDLQLTACLYRIFQQKDKGNKDSWYDFMIHNVLNGIYYSNLQLNRFNAIGIKPKEYISKSYAELQTMLEKIPSENLEVISKQMTDLDFWSNMPTDSKDLKAFISMLNFEKGLSAKKTTAIAKEFINNNPTSMLCEFVDHFIK